MPLISLSLFLHKTEIEWYIFLVTQKISVFNLKKSCVTAYTMTNILPFFIPFIRFRHLFPIHAYNTWIEIWTLSSTNAYVGWKKCHRQTSQNYCFICFLLLFFFLACISFLSVKSFFEKKVMNQWLLICSWFSDS